MAERDAAKKRGEEVIFLYDGPPDTEPDSSKMVCFPSPNQKWFKKMSKKTYARMLVMPLWDVDELVAAATSMQLEVLNPPVTREVIEDRFDIFGGVARCCISTHSDFVENQVEDLERDVNGMDALDVLERMLKDIPGDLTFHRMCHYKPLSNRRRYDVQIASRFVYLRLLEKISFLTFEKRSSLLFFLQRIPKDAAFREHLLEMKAHVLMIHGGKIKTQCITADTITEKEFEIKASSKVDFFNTMELSSATLETGLYHIPRTSNFESIDSFYYPHDDDKKSILLFQMTVAKTHRVNGNGILSVLRALGLLEKALVDPKTVALIFVVPDDGLRTLVDKQVIPWTPVAESETVAVVLRIKKMLEDIPQYIWRA